jgi:hypothetical protein
VNLKKKSLLFTHFAPNDLSNTLLNYYTRVLNHLLLQCCKAGLLLSEWLGIATEGEVICEVVVAVTLQGPHLLSLQYEEAPAAEVIMSIQLVGCQGLVWAVRPHFTAVMAIAAMPCCHRSNTLHRLVHVMLTF